jgi:hypothetical protein
MDKDYLPVVINCGCCCMNCGSTIIPLQVFGKGRILFAGLKAVRLFQRK